MEEQSHKDEMRAALRGDFERMRRRLSQSENEAPTMPGPKMVSDRAPYDGVPDAAVGSWLDRLLGRA